MDVHVNEDGNHFRVLVFENYVVNEHGYVIMDIGESDIFYDETDEQVYLVEFSQIKPYDEVYRLDCSVASPTPCVLGTG